MGKPTHENEVDQWQIYCQLRLVGQLLPQNQKDLDVQQDFLAWTKHRPNKSTWLGT